MWVDMVGLASCGKGGVTALFSYSFHIWGSKGREGRLTTGLGFAVWKGLSCICPGGGAADTTRSAQIAKLNTTPPSPSPEPKSHPTVLHSPEPSSEKAACTEHSNQNSLASELRGRRDYDSAPPGFVLGKKQILAP